MVDAVAVGHPNTWSEFPQALSAPADTRSQLEEPALFAILAAWDEYAHGLPEDAPNWRIGAVYVRDRRGWPGDDTPSVQLATVLKVMTTQRIYVPRENVHYDITRPDSGEVRTFQELLQRGLAGTFVALGVASFDRICRNVEEAIDIKRQLRANRIELLLAQGQHGNDRNPIGWQFEGSAEAYDDMHSRQTSYYVGKAMQHHASQGFPQGPLPEGFIVAERAPSLGSRWGRPIQWLFSEPLAAIIKEGARRYLDGATFGDLADWSRDGDLKGRTPKGRAMTSGWWNQTLTNPKYAGLHKPCVYTGYKRGRFSPKRWARNFDSQLVPCRLPALISADEHRRIVTTARSRQHAQHRRTQ